MEGSHRSAYPGVRILPRGPGEKRKFLCTGLFNTQEGEVKRLGVGHGGFKVAEHWVTGIEGVWPNHSQIIPLRRVASIVCKKHAENR